ncbi:MAG: hypothetical protein WBE37_28985 [Bryobacteraceae bacterium]
MDQERIIYFQKLEERFLVLLKEVSLLFAVDKLSWVREYFDHGEYGLALDAVESIFEEEKQKPSDPILAIIKELSETMGYPLQESCVKACLAN